MYMNIFMLQTVSYSYITARELENPDLTGPDQLSNLPVCYLTQQYATHHVAILPRMLKPEGLEL